MLMMEGVMRALDGSPPLHGRDSQAKKKPKLSLTCHAHDGSPKLLTPFLTPMTSWPKDHPQPSRLC